VCGIALAQQLAGCAGRKPYSDESMTKNVSIRTVTSAGSMFSSVRAALNIYRVDTECRAEYVGTVKLDEPSVMVGIPTGRWNYLVFDFDSSSFPGGTRGRMSHELFLKPQADHRYEIDVTYRDDIYNVVLSERQPRGTLRELRLDPDSCRVDGAQGRSEQIGNSRP
jgi:hypothetical protein